MPHLFIPVDPTGLGDLKGQESPCPFACFGTHRAPAGKWLVALCRDATREYVGNVEDTNLCFHVVDMAYGCVGRG